MRAFTVIFAVFIAVVLIFANVQGAPEGDSDACYEENLKLTIKRGESVYPEGECLRISCSDSGKLIPEPCEFEIPENCHVVGGDTVNKYPDCCPHVHCDKDESEE